MLALPANQDVAFQLKQLRKCLVVITWNRWKKACVLRNWHYLLECPIISRSGVQSYFTKCLNMNRLLHAEADLFSKSVVLFWNSSMFLCSDRNERMTGITPTKAHYHIRTALSHSLRKKLVVARCCKISTICAATMLDVEVSFPSFLSSKAPCAQCHHFRVRFFFLLGNYIHRYEKNAI